MIALFDSNIVIDFLNGVEAARTVLLQSRQAYISPITWIEAQVKAPLVLSKQRETRSMRISKELK